ncbi:MAG: Ig-like domain-containing protein [Bacteroidales bacterium]
MKKYLLLFAFLVFSTFSVKSQVVLTEDFGSGTFPPTGWSISAQPGNWATVPTANAGGQAPEARLNWTPQFNGLTQLITPSINVSENTTGVLSVSFRHMVDHYGGNFQIGLAYRVNNGSWVNIWEQTVTGNIAAETKAFVLEGSFPANAENLQFAIFFNGASFNINYWYIDDFTVMIPGVFDLALTQLMVPGFITEPHPVKGQVLNSGLQEINSFDVNWQLDGGTVSTQSFSGLNLGYLQSFVFETSEMLDLEPGGYLLNVFIDNINGQATDDNPDNNSLQKVIESPYAVVQRRPMFESFTSSTCPPCYTFNINFFNNFVNQNKENLAIVKYQMNWPGSGDPYYTAEGGVRRNYYGVTGVPDLYIDGKKVATNASAVNAAYSQSLAKPAYFDINAYSIMQGQSVVLNVQIMPYASLQNVTLHAIVLENSTTGNAANNGETVFHHVMMKMIPNAGGTLINLTALEEFNTSFTMDVSATNIEDMNDLSVVVFLQDNATREVYQSAVANHGPAIAVKLPVEHEQTDVEVNRSFQFVFGHPMQMQDGEEITEALLQDIVTFQTSGRNDADVAFNASISWDNRRITVTPEQPLDFNTQFTLGLPAFEGLFDLTTDAISLDFTTRSSYGAPVAGFNVNPDQTEVPVEDFTYFITFNQQVRLPDGTPITNANVADLVIFNENDTNGQEVGFTATINEAADQITILPEDKLAFSQLYVLGVGAVLGLDDELSDAQHISFTTRTSKGAPVATFNVDHESQGVLVTQAFAATFNQQVRRADGSAIFNNNVHLLINFREGNAVGATINFVATVNAEKTAFSITPSQNLKYNQTYYLEIAPLMGEDDEVSDPVFITFTTEDNTITDVWETRQLNLFPNPATEQLCVEYPLGVSAVALRIFNASGALQFSDIAAVNADCIDISALAPGVYFLEIQTATAKERRKFVITR